MPIFVKAKEVLDHGNGTFEIVIEPRPMTEEQRKVLHELFPNLTERAYDLLEKELLLDLTLTPDEVRWNMEKNGAQTIPTPVKKATKGKGGKTSPDFKDDEY